MEYLNELIGRYRHKGLLVDTNLLLLYFLGACDPDHIPKFKRTMMFTVAEFWFLARFLRSFDTLVTTPNVLTEVSNMSGQLGEPLRTQFYIDFANLIPQLNENYISSSSASSLAHFSKFGLTDVGIGELAKDTYLVLSDDLKLVSYLQKKDIDAINFNHIRTWAWEA